MRQSTRPPETFVSLRGFRDDGVNEKAIFIEPITVGDPAYVKFASERVKQAANWHQPAVLCPPVVTFKTAKNAKTENIFEGLVLTVECDTRPTEAVTKLQSVLGKPTIASSQPTELPYRPRHLRGAAACRQFWKPAS